MKTGVILSGGGVRGFAHLGLLQALEELNIRPDAISGVSAGAIAGVFYAAGYKPAEILDILKKNSYFGWSNLLWRKDGFFSTKPLFDALKEHIATDSFEQLKIPLFITATDYTHGRSVVFSKGPLFEAITASAAVPVVFEPVRIHEALMVDGGLLNNFPIEPLEGICDHLIGSHVNKIQTGDDGSDMRQGKFNIIEKCFHLAISGTVYAKKDRCAVFIEPPLGNINMFDVKQADHVFEIGYRTTLQHKEKLLGLPV